MKTFRSILNGFRDPWLTNLWIASLFALAVFIKNVLCHYLVFHTVLVSSLWKAPADFFVFYLAKLAPALFLAAFVFVFKSKVWTIVFHFIFDIWIIANLFYFNANHLLLGVSDILLASNMFKFALWNTLSLYWQNTFLLFPVLSVGYTLIVIFMRKRQPAHRQFLPFAVCLLTAWLSLLPVYFVHQFDPNIIQIIEFKQLNTDSEYRKKWRLLIPFEETYWKASSNILLNGYDYLRVHSICSWLPATLIWYSVADQTPTPPSGFTIPEFCFNDKEIKNGNSHYSLVLILVESFESWIFENEAIAREVMPNMYGLIGSEHSLYCGKITSQAKSGVSGDGQMTVNSGLLPVVSGITSERYNRNAFPNLAHFYDSAFIINPSPHIWNQDSMTIRYGYKDERYGKFSDETVFRLLAERIRRQDDSTFCAMAITLASHSPFNRIPERKFNSAPDAPLYLNRYLSCLHYTDSCFGVFLNQLPPEAVLVVTGDHTVFKETLLAQFAEFGREWGITSLAEGKNYCPLIIRSPNIPENTVVEEVCWQMDIFPTILPLIDRANYAWRGLGVNLLDSTARRQRHLTPDEASELSDKLIRSDYFSQFPDFREASGIR